MGKKDGPSNDFPHKFGKFSARWFLEKQCSKPLSDTLRGFLENAFPQKNAPRYPDSRQYIACFLKSMFRHYQNHCLQENTADPLSTSAKDLRELGDT